MHVRNIGGTEMPAYIKGQVLYLPVTDVFSFLKIQNTPTPGFDTVSGFFLNQQNVFLVDRANNRITYQEKVYELKPGDIIQTENNLYLRSDFFGQIFGLDCTFDFRNFSVFLDTKLELPLIREMRQDMMRSNISRLKGDMKTDTIIRRNYPFFHFGTADWSVSATQQVLGSNNVRVNLALGALIAGGEATVDLNYSNTQPFIGKRQYWVWHFANNDFKVVKQVMVGKISPMSTASINGSLIGAMVTNTPTTFQRSFGTYTITDRTQPGWIVELYVNYVLVDYVKADASGNFSFEVPLVYGNSLVKLRFYGPFGEEHTREQSISIPFNFLPPRKLEYTVSAGFAENRQNSRFSRADFHYGVNRRLTVGGGVEYLSSVTSGKTMPFVNLSLRLASSLLISGEYTYGVRLKGVMSFRLRSNIMFELYYTKLNKNQTAIIFNSLEERKAIISMPVRIGHISTSFRLTLYQIILPWSETFSTQLQISGSLFGVSTNLTTYALFSGTVYPYVFSDLSLSFRLPAQIIITPQVQYSYSQSRFLAFKLGVEKQLFPHAVLNFTYDRSFLSNMNSFQVGIRYDFPFAQVNLSARYGNNTTNLMQYARGGLIYEGKEGKLGVSNYSCVGKGGIIIVPFLDLNNNGRKDTDEPRISELNLRITGGRVEKNSHDSTIRVSGLEPYNKYFIELNRNSFDNISWRIPKATISISINPNQYKLVEVPVIVVGEASGYTYISNAGVQSGLSRITVCFYRNDSILVARVQTESDGYFDFFGFSPGSYTARIDTGQLNKLHMTVSPEKIHFTILRTKEGDQVEGLDFVLQSVQSDTVVSTGTLEEKAVLSVQDQKIVQEIPALPVIVDKTVPVPETKPVPLQEKKTVTPVIVRQTVNLPINADSSMYHIQVGAFRVQANAMAVQTKLSATLGRPVIIIQENGFYKIRVTGFTTYTKASTFLKTVFGQGFPDAFIHKNR